MNIKRRLAILERAKGGNKSKNRCQCGAPLLLFDNRLCDQLNNEDAIDMLIAHYAAPCPRCGRQSDVAAKIEFIYGNKENSLAE